MDDLLNAMGPSWGSYQRLRVEETTDDLVPSLRGPQESTTMPTKFLHFSFW
jgi:hypothetical protein